MRLISTLHFTFPRCFNPRTPCGVRRNPPVKLLGQRKFQSTHSLRSATRFGRYALLIVPGFNPRTPCGVRPAAVAAIPARLDVSIHALLAECDTVLQFLVVQVRVSIHALLAECDCWNSSPHAPRSRFQSTHSLRSATAPDLIHCYSTEQIILCANLPKKTVIAQLLFLSIYLSIFYSQCITPIADLPGNSCELEVGAQAMFNSL